MKTVSTKVKTNPAGLVRVPARTIERCIYVIRGYRVMFDSDLAKLYHVPTKAFNQAVMRNRDRFPRILCFNLPPKKRAPL
jgi:hypothetical protein